LENRQLLSMTKSCVKITLSATLIIFTGCGGGANGSSGSSGGGGGSTNTNQWTWVSGSDLSLQSGAYGTLGTASSTNVPGSRYLASSWVDPSGNFWIFGGSCVGPQYNGSLPGLCNDLWKYNGGQWTWMSGSDNIDQSGTYGIMGTPDAANTPGAREGAATWTDKSGNLWLFGGDNGGASMYNDFWKFSAGQWTWMGQASSDIGGGICGTQGVAAPTNFPGARTEPVTWTDSSGNLWMFGGNGIDCDGIPAALNDLWRYSGGEWTWISGTSLIPPIYVGVYGTKGVASPDNIPPGRFLATGFTDTSGDFWLFGGFDGNNNLNDLWKYSAGEWTWISGSNTVNQPSTFGVEGTAATTNVPGARSGASGWTDNSGNFWIQGGTEYYQLSTYESEALNVNEMWKFSGGQWTWVDGANTPTEPQPVYGILGQPSPTNDPGARWGAASWTDASGNFWLYGGYGRTQFLFDGSFNDLWEYQP